jgi:uncharacterized protein with PQ loop repeat
MTILFILGALGTVIGLVRAMPQLVKLLRAREAFGVSVDTAAISSIVSFGWAAYGVLTHQPYVTFATGCSALIFALITGFALRFGRRAKEFKIAPIWLSVLVLVYLYAGVKGLGVALPVSVLAANLPQIWVACKEDDLADLSLGTWLLSMSDGLVWGIYTFFNYDPSIRLFALFQIATSGTIVALKLANDKKSVKAKISRHHI